MSNDQRTPQEIQDDNVAHFMENGPGLSTAYGVYVVAKDPRQGMVMLGGLGGMGVGRMWFTETERHRSYPGYEEAEEVFNEEQWWPAGVNATIGHTCPECSAIVSESAAHFDWHRSQTSNTEDA